MGGTLRGGGLNEVEIDHKLAPESRATGATGAPRGYMRSTGLHARQ
jgi:hypothetical protein